MNNQKGFINLIILIVALVVTGIAAHYVILQKESLSSVQPTTIADNFNQKKILPDKQRKKVIKTPGTSPKQQKKATPSNKPKPVKEESTETTPEPIPTVLKIPESTPVKINSCGTISVAGNYFISRDLLNTKAEPCIKIQNANNVILDCQNRVITGKNENYDIYVKRTSNFKIKNCKLVSSINDLTRDMSSQHVLRIENSKLGEIDNSSVDGNFASISGSSFITIKKSAFTSQLSVYKSNNVIIKDSSFSNGMDPITLQEGKNNSVISSLIDGKSDGVFRGFNGSIGADDGIVIKDESGDIIQGNTLQNFFDCAIENTGEMFDAKIIGNKASNAGVCFLGGWYWSSVKGIIVKDNTVSDTPTLFYFFRQYDLKPNEKYVYFLNNTFENNRMINPKLNTSFSFAAKMIFNGAFVPIQKHILGNNVLRNNDFTKLLGPILVAPANLIKDGGGNICSGAQEDVRGGGDPLPFKCN